jgi:hypothetical protein
MEQSQPLMCLSFGRGALKQTSMSNAKNASYLLSINLLNFMYLHCIILLLNFIVLAKGGSKLETTTAQLARKSSVCSQTPAKVPTKYLLETRVCTRLLQVKDTIIQ